MDQKDTFAVALVLVGATGIWLQSQNRLVTVLQAIYEGPGFVQFGVALLAFLILLALIGEPYSTWLAGIVVLGLLMLAQSRNKDLLKSFGL